MVLAAVTHANLVGFLIAFLVALVAGALTYLAGVYVLHAPQPAVGLVALLIFVIVLLLVGPF